VEFIVDQQEYENRIAKKEGIQWVLPTSKSNVLSVATILHSLHRNRSFSRRKVTLTSRRGVFLAVRPGNLTEVAVAPDPTCRSIQRFVLSVAKKLKYRSNPDRADRYIAVLATAR
jgi:hypothetical protein